MTTPTQPDPMGGAVAGSADLQSAMDQLDRTMINLTTAINGLNNGNGTSTSPSMAPSLAAQGVQFTNGQQGSGGNNGSGGTTGTNPFSFSIGGFNTSSIFGGGSLAQGLANVGTSIVNSQFKQGAQQLNDQAQINTYGYQQAGFWSVSSQSTIQQNFGGGAGHGLYQNNLALNATDARYGGLLLSQISSQANYASANGGTYGRGNAPYQLAASTGLANPGLGMTNSASVSGAWYNPSTSYNLMMMGIASTPLQLGTGKAQSMTGVEAAIGQRFGFQGFNSKSGTFDNQNLAANLNNPLFQMQIMQATGMNQQQYNTWSQQWAQMNQWANSGGITMNQLQTDVSNYMDSTNGAQQGAALNALKKIPGFNMSLLQSMNQAQSGMTATEASGNAAFTQGLKNATDAINKLTNLLSGGVSSQAGTSGFMGAVGSLNASGVSGAGGTGAAGTAISAASALLQSAINDLNGTAAGGNGATGGRSGGGGSSGTTSSGHQGNISNTGSLGTSMVNGWSPSHLGNIPGAYQQDALSLFGSHNWSSSQWPYLAALWGAESGWNPNAYNPSGATGIPQALPGSKMASAGADWRTNPATQIRWGLGYISQVYGSPQDAWKHEVDNGWYADGTTSAKPGLAVVGERGPELVSLSGGQQIINAAQTAKMMQPSFSGGMSGGGGGLTIVFQNGAITMNSTGSGSTSGHHTSADVQSSAAQLEQAIETVLKKNTTLKNIAMGVTG